MGYSRRIALIERNRPVVQQVVGAFIRQHSYAAYLRSDLLAEGDLALIKAVKKLMARRVSNFRTYLRQSIRRACIDVLRRERVVSGLSRGYHANRERLSDYPAQRTNLDCSLVERIGNCCLDDTDRLIVAMLSAEKTIDEIATSLGVSSRTVRRRRQAIAKRFADNE